MNLPVLKDLNLQPLIRWLTRQRTEVVLLVVQVGIGAYGLFVVLPSLVDRIEGNHTAQLKEVGARFQADQARDSKEKELLIQKAFGHRPNGGDPNLAAKP